MPTYSVEEKGRAIIVTGGTYVGCRGYEQLGKNTPVTQVWVILDMDGIEKSVKLNRGNVELYAHPQNYVDAAFEQYPEIVALLGKLTDKLAKLDLDSTERKQALFRKIEAKMDSSMKQQIAKGRRATWLTVDWDDEAKNGTQG